MKVNDMFPSKFLKGEDLGRPVTVTIARVVAERMYKPGQGEITGFVLYAQGATKGVVLSKPLAEGIAQALGESDTDNWPGKQIELYPQKMQVAGRNVTAIRARAAKTKTPATQTQGQNPPHQTQGQNPPHQTQGHQAESQATGQSPKTNGKTEPKAAALANLTIEDVCPTSPGDWGTLYNKAGPWFGLTQGDIATKVDDMGQVKDAVAVFEALKADWLERQQVE